MRKTACPVVWEGAGAQSPSPDPIQLCQIPTLRQIGQLRHYGDGNTRGAGMGTPAGLDWAPTAMLTGTAFEEGIPEGMTALICIRPAVLPGAPPAYCTTAPWPPMVTVTPCTGWGAGTAAILPSTPAGVVWPSPVA